MNTSSKPLLPFPSFYVPLGKGSWIDALCRKLEEYGEMRWLIYLAVILLAGAVLQAVHWISGAMPVGHFSVPLLYAAAISPLSLLCLDYLDRLARRNLERFRPALSVDEGEYAHMAHTLVTMPAAPVLWCHVIGALFFGAMLFYDPTFFGLLRGFGLSDAILYLVGWFNTGMLVVNFYHTLRQLSLVQFFLQRAQRVSIIDRTPVFAFSALTYWTTVVGILWLYSFLYVFPAMRSNWVVVGAVGLSVVLLVAVFFAPLHGMHERLVDEKEAHLRRVRQQIERAFALLDNERSAENLEMTEQIGKRLSTLMVEEAYLEKMPTWPWPAGTVTKLISVALLPMLLLVAERFVTQLLP